jgi:Mlc titration factor MtfA (ptsG expression regulator)
MIGSKRTGLSWASALITQLWNLNYQTWTYRNDILHNAQHILDDLNGKATLIEAIRYELHRGKDELHENYSPFFSFFSTDTITQEDIDKLKQWFKIIRLARERTNTHRNDAFSTPGHLRSWIGLPKRV